MASLEENILRNSKRIVIKVGSSLIIGNNSNLINTNFLTKLVTEIAKFKNSGKEILLVSSGALALGKKSLGVEKKKLKVSEKQASFYIG